MSAWRWTCAATIPPAPSPGPGTRWPWSGSRTSPTHSHSSSAAASSNGSRSHARSWDSRRRFSRTSRRLRSTARTATRSWRCWRKSPRIPRAGCWSSRTTRVYCALPTEWFRSRMDASSANGAVMRRSRTTKATAPSVMSSMSARKSRSATGLGAVAVALALAILAARTGEPESARSARPEAGDDKRWQTVAPGRVEPASGTIKIAAPVMGAIAQVLVKVNDKVFAGEPLIRLVHTEARARLAAADAQVAFRLRARNEENAPTPAAPVPPAARAARPAPRRGEAAGLDTDKAAARLRAEDAVADADKAVIEAQAALDQAAVEQRAGKAPDAALEAARAALARAQERQRQQKAELRRIEADPGTPLPNFVDGQVNVARAEAAAAAAAIERLTIRAPISGTVLQVNAKPGELAAPASAQPLIIIGDVSALRVRAELDERDVGEVKIGQSAVIRADAFRGREFVGKVSFIAPIVEPGRISARGQRNVTDVDVVEVLVDVDRKSVV